MVILNFRMILKKIKVGYDTKDEFLKQFSYGDEFSIFDYPNIEYEIKGVEKYWLVNKDGKPTLSLTEAYKKTPTLGIPYIELNFNDYCGIPVAMFITWDYKHALKIYVPGRGNTIRLDTNRTLSESSIFDFDWENKEILEKSDLLYIVKEINRPALSKYLLRDIYNAFQEYKELDESIVYINRKLCAQEFEEILIRTKEKEEID